MRDFDLPERLLAFAVRRMPPGRRAWGAAMLAELASLREPRARWSFALGCTWATRFSLKAEGSLHTMKTTIVTAISVSTALVAPLVYLQLRYANYGFLDPLFAVLWIVPAAFVLTAAPLVRTVRAGQSIFAHPFLLTVRLGFLVLAGFFWVILVNDQLPCFLGVPNCD
jgi:hypothetical protein